jgi:hypothetical protein
MFMEDINIPTRGTLVIVTIGKAGLAFMVAIVLQQFL